MNSISSPLTPRVGEPAPGFQLCDQDGTVVDASSFWKDGPVAFVFLRHFG